MQQRGWLVVVLGALAALVAACADAVQPGPDARSDAPGELAAPDARRRERCDPCDDDGQCAPWPGTRCIRSDTDGALACFDPNQPANTCL